MWKLGGIKVQIIGNMRAPVDTVVAARPLVKDDRNAVRFQSCGQAGVPRLKAVLIAHVKPDVERADGGQVGGQQARRIQTAFSLSQRAVAPDGGKQLGW